MQDSGSGLGSELGSATDSWTALWFRSVLDRFPNPLMNMSLYLSESENPDIPRAVGSERPAGWPGGVGQDWMPTELFAQETKSIVPSKASKTRRLNVSPEARTSEILCKPMEEQNHRLTPVHNIIRFITRGLLSCAKRNIASLSLTCMNSRNWHALFCSRTCLA